VYVGRRMIIVIHSNDDSEKARDFRHGILLGVGHGFCQMIVSPV
jgi:hypothetical protein